MKSTEQNKAASEIRVFVTGLGVISAIGANSAENHLALVQGKCGIETTRHFSSRYSGISPLGEVAAGTGELKEKLKILEAGITRTTLLALHAFREAVSDAGLTSAELISATTALIGASTVGGMCLTDELYHDATHQDGGSPFLSSYDCASFILFLQAHYGLNGIVNTINTACSSSANAIMYGARLIRKGLAKKAIVGGTDSLAKFTINGFNALQILSPEICMPFDQDRKGLNLGEGAAFLVLEKEDDIGGKNVYAELTGYCNSNDASHPSSLSEEGEGPYLAMKGALDSAGLYKEQIGFINAHGTSTENNDEAESRAMIRLFGEPPPFASTKSNTGHTLGASGAIEAVYGILNLFYQEVYASLNFNTPMATTGLRPVQLFKETPLEHIMSNSFGFGGNCTSLIFSKVH